MTDQCIIGPVSIEEAVLFEDRGKIGVEETFRVFCTPLQAKQLAGLAESAVQSGSGDRVIISGQNRGWGMIPIDSSIILVDNEDAVNRGYYQVVNTEETYIGPFESEVKLTVLKIANLDTLLEMWSTRGYNDGTKLDSYGNTVEETILLDEFTSFDTTVWYAKYAENMAAGNDITPSGGKLQLVGASATNGTWGYLWTTLRNTLGDSFVIEFPLEWVALPAGNPHHVNLFLVDGRPTNKTELEYKDMIRIVIDVKSTGAVLSVDKRVRGDYSDLTDNISLTSSQKTPMIRLRMGGGTGVSNVTVDIDKNWTSGTPTYTRIFGPAATGVNYDPALGRYLILALENASNVSATVKVPSVNIYQDADALPQKVVLCPPDALVSETEDFTRTGEDGTFKAFLNPPSHPRFYLDSDDFFNGGVKAYHTYPDNIARLITNTDNILSPTKFSVKNGLIKLVPTSDSIQFQYWNGSAYVTLNTFTLGTINFMKVLYSSPYLVRFQVNETKWTMKYGKPFVMVEHPTTPLGYTRKTTYYHDGVIHNGLADGADVSMLNNFYALAFTTYNLFTTNAYNIETSWTDWTGYGATVSQVTPGQGGSYALRAQTNNSMANEGIGQTTYTLLPLTQSAGLNVMFRCYLKGTGTVRLYIFERDSGMTLIPGTGGNGSIITLSPTFTPYYYQYQMQSNEARYVSVKALTPTQQAADIYGDEFVLTPTPTLTSVPGTMPPNSAYRYGMIITKTHPTTIKSNSIPASDLTGIGVYDQMQPPLSNNGFLPLSREFLFDNRQKIRAAVL